MREVIVCVHGIWMNGWVMKPLSHYLSEHGHQCAQYSYKSISRSPEENALMLGKFVQQLDADIVHFVAHSYGGLILLHYFQIFDTAKPGRVVMLGAPVSGSGVAKYLSRSNLLNNKMLGASSQSLLGNVPQWKGTHPLAVIAGTKGYGMGQLLGAPLDKPNDGTVAVSETKLSNCTVHIQVPHSHTGLLLSKKVAAVVDEFIRTGDCH
jgi:pimeloyl-ACP methyl ester carboxylesterase